MESSNTGASRILPIYVSSDEDEERAPLYERYSPEDIEIQEAILLSLDSSRTAAAAASAFASTSSAPPSVCATLEIPPDHKGKRKLSPEDNPSKSTKKHYTREHFDCPICFEKVQVSEKFLIRQCAHAFCNTCVGRYVAAKIAENVSKIECPDPKCDKGLVEIDLCQGIIPSELFDRWCIALCEDVLGGDKFYCPFKDCSALLINDGAAKIKETECPHCHRLFCASCRVPWHHGLKCKELKKLGDDEKGPDDLMLKKLANKKNWQRCPNCKMYVSRKSGCLLIRCR